MQNSNYKSAQVLATVSCLLLASSSATFSQENPAFKPKTAPAKSDAKAPIVEERSEKTAADAQGRIPRLNGVMLLQEKRALAKSTDLRDGATTHGLDFISDQDLETVVAPYLGKPATLADLRELQKEIVKFVQTKRHRLLVDIWFPEQKVEKGIVQMYLIEGTVRKVTVLNEGKKYFSDKTIRGKFHFAEGENIDPAQLNRDLDSAAQNSYFRDVSVALKVPDAEKLNTSDVELRVQDRFPLRVFAGYEDSGNTFVGEDRLLAGLNYGNVFGLDHQLNYQYMTDTDFEFLSSHSASYVAPLPWGHTVTLRGAYADITADSDRLGISPITLEGEYYEVGLRYRVPLSRINSLQHGVSFGLEYKRTDNNLAFGGVSVFNIPIEVYQAVLGYDLTLPDRFGRTLFDGNLYYSPGGLTDDNDDASFNSSRFQTTADYFYGRVQLTRETPVYNWNWISRVTGQYSSDRLVSTEQLGAGGYSTVRGYDERVANGDYGVIFNSEIYTPPISFGLGRFFGAKEESGISLNGKQSDQLRFLAFFDYGYVASLDRVASYDPPNATLSSVGGGVRWNFRSNLSVRADYGYQLSDRLGDDRSRLHLGVIAGF